jgi:hypothetical protein
MRKREYTKSTQVVPPQLGTRTRVPKSGLKPPPKIYFYQFLEYKESATLAHLQANFLST